MREVERERSERRSRNCLDVRDSEGKREQEREKIKGKGEPLLMIVTYTAVWLSLATRHDVTPG